MEEFIMKPNRKRQSKMLQYKHRKQFKLNCLLALAAFNNPMYQERIQELREQILDIDQCINRLDDALSNADIFYRPYAIGGQLSWDNELSF
jgi:hypothetical protein